MIALAVEIRCAACGQRHTIYPRGVLLFTFALPPGWLATEGGFITCSETCRDDVRRETEQIDAPF